MKHSKQHVFTLHTLTENVRGPRVLELSGWIGKLILLPRTDIKDIANYIGKPRPCLYMLHNSYGHPNERRVYIGETSDPADRIKNFHAKDKDFWDEVIIVQSPNDYLTFTEIKYLEYHFINSAAKPSTVTLDNSKAHKEPSLNPTAKIGVMQFAERVEISLKAIGYDFFDNLNVSETSEQSADAGIKLNPQGDQVESIHDRQLHNKCYITKENEYDAEAIYIGNKKIRVLEGSKFSVIIKSGMTESAKNKRKELIENGFLVVQGEYYVLKQDILFDNSTLAFNVVAGRDQGGPGSWKMTNGQTLKAFLAERESE